jgi:phage recombination protein Bet
VLFRSSDNPGGSIIASLAGNYGMDKQAFILTMKKTIMGGKDVSNEQIAAFCLVAKEHGLNPFTKEIFAFPANGGIIPVVSVDGWLKLINGHPAFDGMEFVDVTDDKGSLVSVTCKMFRKDRAHPVIVTEYMSECVRGTDVWKRWPARMLRHKATIQAARYAFGFAGIRADGSLHVEVTRHEQGTAWVEDHAIKVAARRGAIVVDPRSATSGVIARLRLAGVALEELSTPQVVQACTAMQDDVGNKALRHLDQPELNAAVAGVDIRTVGESWIFSPKASTVDISPLLAVAFAAFAARGKPPPAMFAY